MSGIAHLGTSGYVSFKQEGSNGVRVNGRLTGLAPGKTHALHVHEYGHAADAMKCGGHYNPHGKTHGGRYDKASHAGDMGNVTAGRDGTARFRFLLPSHKVRSVSELYGRAVILHEGADDLGKGGTHESHTTGSAGHRMLVGIVGRLT